MPAWTQCAFCGFKLDYCEQAAAGEQDRRCQHARSVMEKDAAVRGPSALHGQLSVQRGGSSKNFDSTSQGEAVGEAAWLKAWHERLECWWLTTPYRKELQVIALPNVQERSSRDDSRKQYHVIPEEVEL